MKNPKNIRNALQFFAESRMPILQRKKLLENVGLEVAERRHRGYFCGAVQDVGKSQNRFNVKIERRIAIHAPRAGRALSIINLWGDITDNQYIELTKTMKTIDRALKIISHFEQKVTEKVDDIWRSSKKTSPL